MNSEKVTNKKPTVVSGAIWSIMDNMAAQAITFIIFIILAKILTPDIYGMLSVSLLVSQLFKMMIFDSIATSIIRKKEPSVVDYNSAFFLCFFLSVPAFLIVCFIAPLIESHMKVAELSDVIRGTAVIIVLSGMSRIHEAWLSHNMLFKSLAVRSILSISIGGVVGILMAYNGYAVMSLVMQQVVTSLISVVVLWIKTPWKPKFNISMGSIKESYHFSKHVALSNITNFANQNSDVFFITYFLGSGAAGIYSAGKRIVNTLNMVLSSALMRVSLPAFTRYKNDIVEFGKKYLQATYFTVVVTAPAFIGLAILSKDITVLLLGYKWISSVEIMQIVSAVGFVTSIGYYNHSVMFARDKPEWQARLTLVYAISNIVMFFIFVRYGLIATALAFSLRTVLLYPLSVWCAISLLNLTFMQYLKQIITPIICSLLMAISIYVIQRYIPGDISWFNLALKIFIGMVSYFLFMLALSSKQKISELNILLKKIVARK